MGVHFRGATINITLAVAGKIIVIGLSPYCVLDVARVSPLTYLNAPPYQNPPDCSRPMLWRFSGATEYLVAVRPRLQRTTH